VNSWDPVWDTFWTGSMSEAAIACRLHFLSLFRLADATGVVRATPMAQSRFANIPLVDVKASLDFLERPDPNSSTPDEEGRRIVRMGPNEWRIVNYDKYHRPVEELAARARKREWDRANRPSGGARTKLLQQELAVDSPPESDKSDPIREEDESRVEETDSLTAFVLGELRRVPAFKNTPPAATSIARANELYSALGEETIRLQAVAAAEWCLTDPKGVRRYGTARVGNSVCPASFWRRWLDNEARRPGYTMRPKGSIVDDARRKLSG
jgi:hypothetical protein